MIVLCLGVGFVGVVGLVCRLCFWCVLVRLCVVLFGLCWW